MTAVYLCIGLVLGFILGAMFGIRRTTRSFKRILNIAYGKAAMRSIEEYMRESMRAYWGGKVTPTVLPPYSAEDAKVVRRYYDVESAYPIPVHHAPTCPAMRGLGKYAICPKCGLEGCPCHVCKPVYPSAENAVHDYTNEVKLGRLRCGFEYLDGSICGRNMPCDLWTGNQKHRPTSKKSVYQCCHCKKDFPLPVVLLGHNLLNAEKVEDRDWFCCDECWTTRNEWSMDMDS